ncbi:signal peptidase II [Patescibacteria group bacterium AH-259-L05]|nr:signal peptidase II [Patescibacteria group bacterium AH-259-L05]
MEQVKRWRKQLMFINTLVVFFFIVDRVLKILALSGIEKNIFFINFSVFENPYIAFSLPLSGLLFYVFFGIVLIFVISSLITSYQERKITAVFSLSLIVVGAISNILDRFIYGAVIDYVDILFLFAFNIADAMIMAGVFILVIRSIQKST